MCCSGFKRVPLKWTVKVSHSGYLNKITVTFGNQIPIVLMQRTAEAVADLANG